MKKLSMLGLINHYTIGWRDTKVPFINLKGSKKNTHGWYREFDKKSKKETK